jgi:thiamine-monophosphate kinase
MKEESFIELLDFHQTFDDDCAEIPSAKADTIELISTDSMIENTHFRTAWSSPEDIAIKLIHSSISDLIASGARPEWCLLNAGFPISCNDEHLKKFAARFLSELSAISVRLIGGDTFRSENMHFTLTAGGRARRQIKRRPVKGHSLYLTGPVGASLAGLKILRKQADPNLPANREHTDSTRLRDSIAKHLRPRCRIDLVDFFYHTDWISAAIDVSDGLYKDAGRLVCNDKQNPAGIEIYLDRVPQSRHAQSGELAPGSSLEWIHSGEEYEILFTAPKEKVETLKDRSFCIEIGRVTQTAEILLYRDSKSRQKIEVATNAGYDHFSSGPEKY